MKTCIIFIEMFLTKIDNSDTHGNLIISHTRIIMECVLKPIVSNMVERSQLTLYWGVVFLFLEMEGGGLLLDSSFVLICSKSIWCNWHRIWNQWTYLQEYSKPFFVQFSTSIDIFYFCSTCCFKHYNSIWDIIAKLSSTNQGE